MVTCHLKGYEPDLGYKKIIEKLIKILCNSSLLFCFLYLSLPKVLKTDNTKLQKLLPTLMNSRNHRGNINWICPHLKLTSLELGPFVSLLKKQS